MSLSQLLALGYATTTVDRMVSDGRLHRLHPGVFSVGHRRLSRRAMWLAAVLAAGPGAALSHRSAWALWEIGPGSGRRIDVLLPRHSSRRLAGVRTHASRRLIDHDTTAVDGIPTTTVERTLLDLADVLTRQRLRLAFEDADRRELLHGVRLAELLDRSPGRRGLRPLRAILAATATAAGPQWTRSELEREFLSLIRAAGLPEPQCNVLVHGELVDFFWPEAPLVVELDGYRYHRDRRTFENDRRRDAKLLLAGIPVIRFTAQRVRWHAPAVVSTVAEMLARRVTNLL